MEEPKNYNSFMEGATLIIEDGYQLIQFKNGGTFNLCNHELKNKDGDSLLIECKGNEIHIYTTTHKS